MKRCVVTGMGVNTSLGSNVDEFWENVVNGKTGLSTIEGFSTEGCQSHIAGEIKNYQYLYKTSKVPSNYDKLYAILISAIIEALNDSGLIDKDKNTKDYAVVIGSCCGGALSLEKYMRNQCINENDVLCTLKQIPIQTAGYYVADYLNTVGPVTSISNACASGNVALAYGKKLIETGITDVAIVAGVDTLSSFVFAGFNSLKSLDIKACSPLSRSNGLTLGEGAGAIVLESYENAIKRKRKIYAYLSGTEITQDGYNITSPNVNGDELKKAINKILAKCNMDYEKIDYINVHGTGTKLNDNVEKKVIKELFYKKQNSVKISSTKSMTGHCLGAAGSIEAIIVLQAMEHGIIPPTINFNKDLEKDIDCVPNKASKKSVNIALSNSLAFGGVNSVILFSKEAAKNNELEKRQKVYITGIGILSNISTNKEEYLENIKNNCCELKYNADYRKVKKVNYKEIGISPLIVRKYDRLSKLAVAVSVAAMKDSTLEINEENQFDVGILFGTAYGPMDAMIRFEKSIIHDGIALGNAIDFPNTVVNAAAGYLSILKKIKGITTTFENGNIAAFNTISYGFELISSKQQSIVVATSADELNEELKSAYKKLGFTSCKDTDSYSYIVDKSGAVIGEGAASIILESEDSVKLRNSRKYAEIVGYAYSRDELKLTEAQSGLALDIAIQKACTMARISLNEMDAIVGFGNGDSRVDNLELDCYMRVFGKKISKIDIYNIKKVVGECWSASVAMQIAHGALLLSDSIDDEYFSHYYKINYNGLVLKINMKTKKHYKYVLVTGYALCNSYGAIILKSTM